jgi:hypothetical protein
MNPNMKKSADTSPKAKVYSRLEDVVALEAGAGVTVAIKLLKD